MEGSGWHPQRDDNHAGSCRMHNTQAQLRRTDLEHSISQQVRIKMSIKAITLTGLKVIVNDDDFWGGISISLGDTKKG